MYIFQRARTLNKKAAVENISYGGYSGAHDGTNGWEMAIDDLLQGPGAIAMCHGVESSLRRHARFGLRRFCRY